MRGFSDAERAAIRRQLKETGRTLFARYGLQKTTVAELTEPVGIGTSTFYQFYDSKDDLYRDVLADEEAEMATRIVEASFESTDDPRLAIERFLAASFEEIEHNPLLEAVLVEDEFDRVDAGYTAAEKASERRRELSSIRPYVEEWQEAGVLREGDPDVIAGALRAVVFLTLHRDDVGEDYPAVRDLLVEVVADGLVTDEASR